MTDEQRKSVALEYLKAFDNKGVTSSGGSILDLFADDAQVFFPKCGGDFGSGNTPKVHGAPASAGGPMVRRVRGARLPHSAMFQLPGS